MPKENQTYQRIETSDDLVDIVLIYDGTSKRQLGNFLGLHGIPPQGGRAWYAVNGDHGDVETEADAEREILEAWGR